MTVYTTGILDKKEIKVKIREYKKINFEKSWSNRAMNLHVPLVSLLEV